jgi:cholesterol transport system auxiliary component
VKRLAAALVLVLPAVGWALSGCALISRGKTLDVHWYTPERVRPALGTAEMQTTCELRLVGVTAAGADLGPRIVYGDGAFQVGRYADRRWSERPEHYLRRALARSLFEEGRFRRALSVDAPTLEAELLDFEEITAQGAHAARIAVHFLLASDRALAERTVVVTAPVNGGKFEDFVAAMANALDETARQVGDAARGATSCSTAP